MKRPNWCLDDCPSTAKSLQSARSCSTPNCTHHRPPSTLHVEAHPPGPGMVAFSPFLVIGGYTMLHQGIQSRKLYQTSILTRTWPPKDPKGIKTVDHQESPKHKSWWCLVLHSGWKVPHVVVRWFSHSKPPSIVQRFPSGTPCLMVGHLYYIPYSSIFSHSNRSISPFCSKIFLWLSHCHGPMVFSWLPDVFPILGPGPVCWDAAPGCIRRHCVPGVLSNMRLTCSIDKTRHQKITKGLAASMKFIHTTKKFLLPCDFQYKTHRFIKSSRAPFCLPTRLPRAGSSLEAWHGSKWG